MDCLRAEQLAFYLLVGDFPSEYVVAFGDAVDMVVWTPITICSPSGRGLCELDVALHLQEVVADHELVVEMGVEHKRDYRARVVMAKRHPHIIHPKRQQQVAAPVFFENLLLAKCIVDLGFGLILFRRNPYCCACLSVIWLVF